MNIRTDLAMEAREIYRETEKEKELQGVSFNQQQNGDITITTLEITDKESGDKLGKPTGKYVTIESGRLKTLDPEFSEEISFVIKKELENIMEIKDGEQVLVVGLGNRNITPDALGPETISKIMVTRHIFSHLPEFDLDNLRPVSAISPGVLGLTGIETGDVVKGITEKINPSLVIAIDALASKSTERISTTIQITDTGINPGSGVGNKRSGLNKETLGIPVIAIGVPTVVDAMTITLELVNKMAKDNPELNKLDELNQAEKDFIVTPKEIDSIISHISTVIANGINLSLHKDIDLEYIESFTF